MELAADEPRMGLQLDDLDERSIGRESTQSHSMFDECIAVGIRYFIPVTVALRNLGHSIDLCCTSTRTEPARIRAESHGAAHVSDVLLRFHQRDHCILTLGSKLAGVTVV